MRTDRETLRTTDLPADFADALRPMTTDGEPPATLEDAVAAFDNLWAETGVRVSVEQMYQSQPTRHAVDFGDRVEHVPCVLDALISAYLIDPRGTVIRSKSPSGESTVRLALAESGIDVDPPSAVFSLGVDASEVANPEVSARLLKGADSVVMASCSFINSFRSAEAFEQWEQGLSDAHVMPIGIDELAAFAQWAADEWVVHEGSDEGRMT